MNGEITARERGIYAASTFEMKAGTLFGWTLLAVSRGEAE